MLVAFPRALTRATAFRQGFFAERNRPVSIACAAVRALICRLSHTLNVTRLTTGYTGLATGTRTRNLNAVYNAPWGPTFGVRLVHSPAKLSAFLFTGLALFLSGCSSGFIETRPDDLRDLPKDYGVVAIQVVNNIDLLSPYRFSWRGAHVLDLDTPSRRFRLKPVDSGLIGSRVFIGAMPPGSYRIYNLRSRLRVGGRTEYYDAAVGRVLGTFRIESDRLTNLGTVAFQPLDRLDADGHLVREASVIRYDEDENFRSFISEATPRLDRKLPSQTLGWEPDDQQQKHRQYASIVDSLTPGSTFHWLDGGEIAMTGPLGAVFLREGPSQWRRIKTGFSHQLLAMTRTREGYAVAGERGLVMHADALAGEWETVQGPGLMTAVEWIDQMENGTLYVVARRGEICTLYHVTEGFSQWQPIVVNGAPGGLHTGALCAMHARKISGERLLLFDNSKRIILDGQGKILSEGRGDLFSAFRTQPNGVALALAQGGTPFWSAQLNSTDYGESWHQAPRDWPTESPDLFANGAVMILSDGRSIALSYKGYVDDFSRRILYENQARLRIANTEGEIVRWGEKVDAHCNFLLPEISTEHQIFVLCQGGSLIVTEDSGQSWTYDFMPGGNTEAGAALTPLDTTVSSGQNASPYYGDK